MVEGRMVERGSRVRSTILLRPLMSLLVLVPQALEAQQPIDSLATGLVVGRVVEGDSTAPVAGAVVYVENSHAVALTDSAGAFRLMLPAGVWTILAYDPEGGDTGRPPGVLLTLAEGATLRADIDLDSGDPGSLGNPFAVEGVDVVARSSETSERLRSGRRVDVLDSEFIRERENAVRHVGDLIRGQFPGVRVRPRGAAGFCIESTRRWPSIGGSSGGCQGLAVVLDGALIQRPAQMLQSLSVHEIEGIRYLSSIEAHTRYGLAGSNGALVITTRRGPGW